MKLDSLKAGIVAAIGMAFVLATAKFTPDIGPSFNFNWWASFILGAILWMIHFVVKKKQV